MSTSAAPDVQQRREQLGLTIEALASLAGVSRDTLSDMETGKKRSRSDSIAKVRRALTERERLAETSSGPSHPDLAYRPHVVHVRLGDIEIKSPADTEQARADLAALITELRRSQLVPEAGPDDGDEPEAGSGP